MSKQVHLDCRQQTLIIKALKLLVNEQSFTSVSNILTKKYLEMSTGII